MASPNFIAGGDISVSTFVKESTSADNTALQCGAGEKAIGISQEGSHDAPIPSASALAATSGKQLRVYGLGEICMLTAYTGGYTRGAFLKSAADGTGLAATTGEWYGAVALESATAGAKGRVQVAFGTL